MEEKYYETDDEDTSSHPGTNQPRGEIAWYPFNGNLNDSTENNIPIILIGDTTFVSGINEAYGKGIHLNGSSCLLINLGYYDTISIVFWVKGDGEIDEFNQAVLFDYGSNAISALLDGSTGASSMSIKKNGDAASSDDASVGYLNSFNKYSFFYFEAGGDLTKVFFKGYASDETEIIYTEDLNFPGIIDPESEMLYIGRSSQRENQNESFFSGAIDEIHIYSRSLTELEIESFAFINTD